MKSLPVKRFTVFNRDTDNWYVDAWLLSVIAMLAVYSIFVVFSATGESAIMTRSHVYKLGLGVLFFMVMSRVNVALLKQVSLAFYLSVVVALVAVDLFGDLRMGAQRWLDLGFVSFQPSDLAKIAVPMACAYMVSISGLCNQVGTVAAMVAIILAPCVLVLGQPDLGTAIMIGMSGVVVLILSGLPWKTIGASVAAAAALAPLAWQYMLHPYQRKRIETVLNPEADPLGAGYHVIQSKIAISSGGMSGQGWLNGTQSQLGYIPERHTDFIFSVLSEEMGFQGVVLLLLLYACLLGRLLWLASKLNDIYAKCFAGAVASLIFAYVIVNIGMVSGVLPVVGVPLPIFSYAGTANITFLIALGMVSAFVQQDRQLQNR